MRVLNVVRTFASSYRSGIETPASSSRVRYPRRSKITSLKSTNLPSGVVINTESRDVAKNWRYHASLSRSACSVAFIAEILRATPSTETTVPPSSFSGKSRQSRMTSPSTPVHGKISPYGCPVANTWSMADSQHAQRSGGNPSSRCVLPINCSAVIPAIRRHAGFA